jgi:oligopeptide transport system ATP-binding protein
MKHSAALLETQDLTRHFPAGGGRYLRAVEEVTLQVARGETLGLVGESGCGKSTLGRLICRLEEPTRGSVRFDGTEVVGLPPVEMRRLRPRMQMIFQDPFSSLNPHKTVEQIVGLPLWIGGMRGRAEIRRRVAELLRLVGLDPSQARRFPHQFSGGQRQRIGIARALASEPDLMVADEPVASLDVSIQAQVLDILRQLQRRFHLTLIFISHDISVVSYMSQRIAVMYLGRIVEMGPAEKVIHEPLHPYTRALIAAVPSIDDRSKRPGPMLSGDVPSPMSEPAGCPFNSRCYLQQTPACEDVRPDLREVRTGHSVACHLAYGDEQR